MLSGCDELQFPKSQSSPTIPQKLPHQAFPARQGDELQVKFFKFFFSEKKKENFSSFVARDITIDHVMEYILPGFKMCRLKIHYLFSAGHVIRVLPGGNHFFFPQKNDCLRVNKFRNLLMEK